MRISLFVLLGFCVLVFGCQSMPEKNGSAQTEPQNKSTPTPTPTPLPPTPTFTPTPTPTPTPMIDREKAYALFLLGRLQHEEGKYADAADTFWNAHEIDPSSAIICSSAANALLLSGELEQAEVFAKQSIKINPDQTEAYEVLAQCYINLRDDEKAVQQYEMLLRQQPDKIEYMNELANLYVSVQRYNDAVNLFRDLIEKDPPNVELYHLQLAHLLITLKRFDEALVEYRYLTGVLPDKFEPYLQLGTIYHITGRDDEALDAYFTALDHIHSPQDELTVRRKMGNVYKSREAWTEAVFQYERVTSLIPSDIEARKTLVDLYDKQGSNRKALNELEELIRLKPDDVELHELRFHLHSKLNEKKVGYKQYMSALSNWISEEKLNPINQILGILIHEGTLDEMEQLGITDELKQVLKQCAAMQTVPVRTYFAHIYFYQWQENQNLTEVHQQQLVQLILQANKNREYETVEKICFELLNWPRVRRSFVDQPMRGNLTRALQSSSALFASMHMPDRTLGSLAIDRQDWNSAETAFQTSLQRLVPGSDDYKTVLFQLTWAYDKLNRIADVEHLMEEAERLYPQEANVYNYLGYFYADRNIHLDQALVLIEKALKLSPNDPNIMDSMGWVYFRLERYEDALQMLKRAVELDSEHPVIAMHLADVYHKLGQTGEALPYWKHVLQKAEEYPGEFTDNKLAEIRSHLQQAESNG